MSESTQVLDAPEQTEANSQATEATPQSDEQEADALLAELTADTGTEAEAGDGTEAHGKEQPEEDEETRAAIEARAAELAEQRAREAEAKRKAEEAKAKEREEEERLTQNFRGRIEAIEKFCIDQGMSQEAAQRVAATFNAHHAEAKPVAIREERQELIKAAGLEDYEWQDPASFIEAVREATKADATKGLLSEAQVNRKVADALLAQKRRYQKNPELLTSQTRGAGTHEGGLSMRSITREQIERATPQQVEKWLNDPATRDAVNRIVGGRA